MYDTYDVVSRRRIGAQGLSFLRACGLQAQEDAEITLQLWQGEQLVASGSLDRNVIKYVACDEAHRGEGLIARVVSLLISEAAARGRTQLFLFTKEEKAPLFASLGFMPLCSYAGATLLERGGGLAAWLRTLHAPKGVNGAIVMKCDPVTLGHLHLIEYAAAQVDHLHIFALKEDTTHFPAAVRESMLRAATAHLPHVTVHPGSDYVISHATFPMYFLGENDDRTRVQAGLDAALFAAHIAPALHITRRFAGEEPFSPATSTYNRALCEVLPAHGIDMTIIPRLTQAGEAISASRVRALLHSGDIAAAQALTPPAVWPFFKEETP